MSEPAETSGRVLDVPASAWAFAWSFVAGQVLELARRGTQSEEAWPLSMVLRASVRRPVVMQVLPTKRRTFGMSWSAREEGPSAV